MIRSCKLSAKEEETEVCQFYERDEPSALYFEEIEREGQTGGPKIEEKVAADDGVGGSCERVEDQDHGDDEDELRSVLVADIETKEEREQRDQKV